MVVYRITAQKHAHDLKGTGAAMYGGRWNKKGRPVLYTGESIEIALLETLVHIPPMLSPKLDLLKISIPNSISEIKKASLPNNWRDYPAPTILAEIAEKHIADSNTIALKVPSSIISSAYNYILNCSHPDFDKKATILKQSEFRFDTRLLN